jgi:transposase
MFRLNILPEDYIYPKDERVVRDLLRRRFLFVKHKETHISSLLQSMISRTVVRGCSREPGRGWVVIHKI